MLQQCRPAATVRGRDVAIGQTVPMTSSIDSLPIHTLHGDETSLAAFDGKAILAVNVASKCGLTPQYTGPRGAAGEVRRPGFHRRRLPVQPVRCARSRVSAEEIETFCSTTYGVTFPMMEKIDVNGAIGTRSTPS